MCHKRSKNIWSLIALHKRKMDKKNSPELVRPEYVTIPTQLIDLNKYVTLAVDMKFLLMMPFMVTLSRCIWYVTVQFVPTRMAGELVNALKLVIGLY